MSTVLWANQLIEGKVSSEKEDRYALYKHLDKLDSLCRAAGIMPLSEMCDSTDMRVNLGKAQLPEGMQSTYDLMAQSGVWTQSEQALQALEKLKAIIQQQQTRFGLLKNAHQEVVDELTETITYLKGTSATGAQFNFAIVM